MAEGGGLLNRTGSHQALTKQAKTRNFVKRIPDRNSVLCLPIVVSRHDHCTIYCTGRKELRCGKQSDVCERELSRRVRLPFGQRQNRGGGALGDVMNGLSAGPRQTIIRSSPQVRECLDRILEEHHAESRHDQVEASRLERVGARSAVRAAGRSARRSGSRASSRSAARLGCGTGSTTVAIARRSEPRRPASASTSRNQRSPRRARGRPRRRGADLHLRRRPDPLGRNPRATRRAVPALPLFFGAIH